MKRQRIQNEEIIETKPIVKSNNVATCPPMRVFRSFQMSQTFMALTLIIQFNEIVSLFFFEAKT